MNMLLFLFFPHAFAISSDEKQDLNVAIWCLLAGGVVVMHAWSFNVVYASSWIALHSCDFQRILLGLGNFRSEGECDFSVIVQICIFLFSYEEGTQMKIHWEQTKKDTLYALLWLMPDVACRAAYPNCKHNV